MKTAYLILAHKNPYQLAMLVNRLNSENAVFFIHLDRRIKAQPFIAALRTINNVNCVFVKKVFSRWGSISVVRAVLNGLNEIFRYNKSVRIGYVHWLSGQDYPLKRNDFIDSFFTEQFGKNFINYFPIPRTDGRWPECRGGLDRIEKYYFSLKNKLIAYPFDENYHIKGKRMIEPLLRLYFRKPRVFPSYLKPYGGLAYFSITMEAVAHIINFVYGHPGYLKFHTYTLFPDEIFFHSILLNSKDEKFRQEIVNDNLRCIKWSGSVNPKIFTTEDLGMLTNSGKIFARKFDITVDAAILNKLDNLISCSRGNNLYP